jgi:hypothetical protein
MWLDMAFDYINVDGGLFSYIFSTATKSVLNDHLKCYFSIDFCLYSLQLSQ